MKKKQTKKTALTKSDIPKIVQSMKNVFPTRNELHTELQKFATKDELHTELQKFATKDELHTELQKFATREELHNVVRLEVDSAKEELRAEIRLLPTKEEFFSSMDKLSGEIEKVREEQILHAGQHEEINNRFDRIDKHLGISTAG